MATGAIDIPSRVHRPSRSHDSCSRGSEDPVTGVRLHARRLLAAAAALAGAGAIALPGGGGGTAVAATAAAGHGSTPTAVVAGDVRILLARTYLQTGGPKNIPLPAVSQVIGGREVTLPPCPAAADRDLRTGTRGVRASLARGREPLRRVIERMRRSARVPRIGRFPYCSWWLPVDVKTLNIAFPDSNAVYWVLPIYVPVQQQVILHGTFPDARYISFAIYNQELDPYTYTPPGGRPVKSYIADYQIRPDAGSLNPWRTPGAQPGGTYTIRIAQRVRARERNVLPLLQDAAASQTAFPIPPPCDRPGAPACTLPGVFTAPPAADQSSVFSNPDNTYLPAILRPDRRDRVWVVRGRMPTTPSGTSPVAWPNRRYQMRYWSMCSAVYERPYPTIIDSGCLVDDDVITDATGDYTIVVSTGRARPATADRQHGVNWIRVRPGVANLLILRNMLGGGFRYSTQNVTKDGSWQTAYLSMRQYYPTITVECTTRHYDANGWQGCVAPKGSGTVGRRSP